MELDNNQFLAAQQRHNCFRNSPGPATVHLMYDIFLKIRIRETPTLSTDADRRTDTILERLHDLSPAKGLLEGGGHTEHIPVFRALF